MSKKSRTGWVIAVISVVAIVAVVLVIANIRSQASSTPTYQTVAVQLGTLTSSVEGTGSVASAPSAILTWKSSGQVAQVNAKIGDKVKADAVLASLVPDSQTQTNLEANLLTAQENLAELTSPAAIATARQAVAQIQQDVTNDKVTIYDLTYYYNDAAYQDKYAALILALNNYYDAQEAFDKVSMKSVDDPIYAEAYQRLYDSEVAVSNARYYTNAYSVAAKPSQTKMDEANATLALDEAKLAEAQNYVTALTGGVAPENATGTSLLKLNQAKLAVQSAQENIQANLDSLQLTAPFDGTITQADVDPYAIVSPGTTAFRIDDLTNLVVAVQVIEIDINSVKIGQSATITFDAIPNKTYTGTVTKADLAGTVGQNSVNYTVTVKVTDADAQVKPGMSANVSIITNQVENALLVPSTAILTDNNGNPYVTLVQNGLLTQVQVSVGAISDTSSQITSDNLKEGDLIVLSFATTSSSSGGGFGMFGGGGGPTGPANDDNP